MSRVQALGSDSLLQIANLEVHKRSKGATVPVLRDVNLHLLPGESLGIVGESGSGKSMMLRAIMRQLPDTFESQGSILFEGNDLSLLSRRELANIRSKKIGMIYQDPRAHINPMWKISDFLTEGVISSKLLSRREALKRAEELLLEVGIRDPKRRLSQYPSQLSGGLLQRVMIVAALMPEPTLLLADEPTTALDVTVQAEVMSIFRDITQRHQVGLILITHDLDLAAATTDKLAVMYAGEILESGDSTRVVAAPKHPYTDALLAAKPDIQIKQLPKPIPGRPATAAEAGDACIFADRCAFVRDECREHAPLLAKTPDGGMTACMRYESIEPLLRRGSL